MKKAILPLALACGVLLAALAGASMEVDILPVVVGVGMAAGVPLGLLAVAWVRRLRLDAWRSRWPPRRQTPAPSQQPSWVMLNPAVLPWPRSEQPYLLMLTPDETKDGRPRRLHVVGNDEEWPR